LHLLQDREEAMFLLHQRGRASHHGGCELADGEGFAGERPAAGVAVARPAAGQAAIVTEVERRARVVDDAAAADVLDHPLGAFQQCTAATGSGPDARGRGIRA
jgi:hypothetical protein